MLTTKSIPIPKVLNDGISTCLNALLQDGCVPGIFRENALKSDEVRLLYLHFLRGNSTLPKNTPVDVHAVSNVLKRMLKELPETLVTNAGYENLVGQNLNVKKVTQCDAWE